MTGLGAVVFDFDGLIVDTEWSIYEMARDAFVEIGHELTVEAWSSIVGFGDNDDRAWDVLCTAMGARPDRAAFSAAYAAQPRPDRNLLPALPGVVELVDDLEANGVRIGVASSSNVEWLHQHLGRLELLERFGAVVGADLVGGVGKPAPDVYLRACEQLGIEPASAVAIEDSSHGITAAKAAGMRAVAVPSEVTRSHAFDQADLVVGSLLDLTVEKLAALTL